MNQNLDNLYFKFNNYYDLYIPSNNVSVEQINENDDLTKKELFEQDNKLKKINHLKEIEQMLNEYEINKAC